MQITLNDKVAVVTVAAQGIGWAIAKRLAASGAEVVVVPNEGPPVHAF